MSAQLPSGPTHHSSQSIATSKPASSSHASRPSTTNTSSRPRPVSIAVGGSNLNPPLRTTISSSAIVADKAVLIGPHEITIGAHAVIHPFARLDASKGTIDIGDGAIIWERAHIGAPPAAAADEADSSGIRAGEGGEGVQTEVGQGTMVEASAVVEAGAKLGDNCSVEVGARVGAMCVLGNFVKLAPCTVVPSGQQVDAYSTYYWTQGADAGESRMAQQVQRCRVNTTLKDNLDIQDLQRKSQQRHAELLKRLVKNNLAKWTTKS